MEIVETWETKETVRGRKGRKVNSWSYFEEWGWRTKNAKQYITLQYINFESDVTKISEQRKKKKIFGNECGRVCIHWVRLTQSKVSDAICRNTRVMQKKCRHNHLHNVTVNFSDTPSKISDKWIINLAELFFIRIKYIKYFLILIIKWYKFFKFLFE